MIIQSAHSLCILHVYLEASHAFLMIFALLPIKKICQLFTYQLTHLSRISSHLKHVVFGTNNNYGSLTSIYCSSPSLKNTSCASRFRSFQHPIRGWSCASNVRHTSRKHRSRQHQGWINAPIAQLHCNTWPVAVQLTPLWFWLIKYSSKLAIPFQSTQHKLYNIQIAHSIDK